jgi:GNAT superfamily N-acetyltransferase
MDNGAAFHFVAVLSSADIESIERATLAAVAPHELEEFEGWLLAYDRGAISRAKSAVPLSHVTAPPASATRIERRYHERNLAAAFRLADLQQFEPLYAELRALGYAAVQPTLVMVAECATVRALANGAPVTLAAVPDERWTGVFAGPGFDAAEGAARARALSRAKDAIYASIDDQGATVAIGTASFGFGWASVHGMRTITHARGRGFASRILAALAGAALERGCARMFLQVEESNAARRLYERAGFATAWRYRYWRR